MARLASKDKRAIQLAPGILNRSCEKNLWFQQVLFAATSSVWVFDPAKHFENYKPIFSSTSTSDGIATPPLDVRIEFLHSPPDLQWCAPA